MDVTEYDALIRRAAARAAPRHRVEADDVAQESRIRLLAMPGPKGVRYMTKVIFRAAFALSKPRRTDRVREVAYCRLKPTTTRAANRDRRIDVADALLLLPPKQREAATLVWLHGYSAWEAGRKIGKTHTAILHRLKGARPVLESYLSAYRDAES